jgi:hypothetical protein
MPFPTLAPIASPELLLDAVEVVALVEEVELPVVLEARVLVEVVVGAKRNPLIWTLQTLLCVVMAVLVVVHMPGSFCETYVTICAGKVERH